MPRLNVQTLLSALCIGMFAVIPAAAQDSGDGTIYSRFGIGELQWHVSPRAAAMGGSGVALHSPNYLNLSNPATLSYQAFTRLAAGARYRTIKATNAAGDESLLDGAGLAAIQFGVPLLAGRLGIGLGFQPYSLVNYRVVQGQGFIVNPVTADSTLYRVDFEGSGGLQEIRAAGGYRLTDNFRVGASANFIFGLFEDARQTVFPGGGFQETSLTRATRLFGVTGTLGGVYDHVGLFGEEDRISAGASFTLPARLNGRQVLTLGENLNPDTLVLDDSRFVEGSVEIPWHTHLGVAYQPDERWTLAASGAYQPWSTFESDFTTYRFGASGGAGFTDHLRISGGVEFLPAGDEQLAPYYARVAYRLGGYVDQSYVRPVSDTPLQTMAVTAGLSLPTMISGTRIDLTMEAGVRGTTKRSLVQDRYLQVSAHVNIGEYWFLERRIR